IARRTTSSSPPPALACAAAVAKKSSVRSTRVVSVVGAGAGVSAGASGATVVPESLRSLMGLLPSFAAILAATTDKNYARVRGSAETGGVARAALREVDAILCLAEAGDRAAGATRHVLESLPHGDEAPPVVLVVTKLDVHATAEVDVTLRELGEAYPFRVKHAVSN